MPAAKYGRLPAMVWLPSDGVPCPGQCLNLTYFTFISSSMQNSCICDYNKLASARDSFSDAYQ